MRKPRIAVIPGDPSGIGPELVAKLLSDPETAERADILLIGDSHVLSMGETQSEVSFERTPCDPEGDWTRIEPIAWFETETIREDEFAVASSAKPCGKSAIENLSTALDFVKDGVVDGLLFAPFNKEALHMAGLGHNDELHFIAEYLGADGYISEVNTLDGIWTSRVTSHIALRDVADTISEDRICEAILLIDGLLRRSGIKRPRISVAALNPHAGDGGNFGSEEICVIRPAVEKMAARQLAVDGPWPSDTVFLKAKAGEIDAVVTMYHDQGQIALKLMGFDRGVSVLGGLPVPVATPAHGTAFDIAGKGIAEVSAIRAALATVCDMVSNRR
ncbi:MAG: 4-hydroxythreonine-4-phosphate dehydrogenase PdxA [Albidovulum sp.]|nr:4-hydroxythreonine-4-phosphate dehydrogenase PdxA [Albidovulum sp.]